MSRRRSLLLEAKELFMDELTQGKIPIQGNKLPSEEELARNLDVSRTTMRELLAALHKEGVITKRHGLGNFIHFSALEQGYRIDRTRDFGSLIALGGKRPGYSVSSRSLTDDTDEEKLRKAFSLPLSDAGRYVSTRCTFFADGEAAIHCLVFVPEKLLTSRPTDVGEENVYAFLRKYCGQEVEHTLIWFEPTSCDTDLSSCFGIPEGTPIIEWKEQFYNIYDEVICYSLTWFHPVSMKLSMLRKTWEDFSLR